MLSNNYNIIIVWDISNPSNMRQLNINELDLITYQFSANDSNKIYALYKDRTVRDWNVKDNKFSILVTLSENFDDNDIMLFSKNVNFLINKNQTRIQIWDFFKKEESCLEVQKEFYLMVCSQNEDVYAVAIEDRYRKGIKFFKKGEYQSEIKFFENEIDSIATSICFSHNDQQLVICLYYSIYLYQINKELEYKILGGFNINAVTSTCVFNSMNMNLVIIADMEYLCVLKLEPTILREEILLLDDEEIDDYCRYGKKKHILCFSPDSKYLASLRPGIQIQELEDLQMIHKFQQSYGEWISFQSKDILVISDKNLLQFFNIIKKKKEDKVEIEIQIQIFQEFQHQCYIQSFTFSQTHLFIYFTKQDKNRVIIKEIDNLKQDVFKAIYSSHGEPIVQENGNYFAIRNKNKIQIINIQNIQQERCLELYNKSLSQIFYLSDENLIILCLSNQIQILNSVSFEIIGKKDHNFGNDLIQFSKISKYWVFQNYRTIEVFTIENDVQELLPYWKFGIDNDNYFDCMALSQKGDLLLTGENNGKDFTNTITLWKIEQREKICTNNKINDRITILKFCPDGVSFAAGLTDGSINLYIIDISKTNFFSKKQQLKQNENFYKFQIICIKSFSKQSLLTAQYSNLSASQIESEKKSIVELFNQKGGIK